MPILTTRFILGLRRTIDHEEGRPLAGSMGQSSTVRFENPAVIHHLCDTYFPHNTDPEFGETDDSALHQTMWYHGTQPGNCNS